jgi:hypothetical protein
VVTVRTAEQSPAPTPSSDPTVGRAARLHQPWRGLVAFGEVVLAVAAVLVGVLCWHRGVTTMVTPLGPGQPPLVSTIFYGSWMAGGIGLVTVAAFLALDACRQAVLAVRTRRRPPPPLVTVAEPTAAAEHDSAD